MRCVREILVRSSYEHVHAYLLAVLLLTCCVLPYTTLPRDYYTPAGAVPYHSVPCALANHRPSLTSLPHYAQRQCIQRRVMLDLLCVRLFVCPGLLVPVHLCLVASASPNPPGASLHLCILVRDRELRAHGLVPVLGQAVSSLSSS